MNKIQGLLNWCKYHTDGYPNVSVTNFTTSWKSGMAFNALVHRFKPELIDFHRLDPENEYYNNYTAFKLAETHFGIPSLLDPKDMVLSSSPEKLSIITYVSQFYNCLKDMDPNGGPDINRFGNTNNDNLDVEMLSSRTSVNELARAKCTICRNKVYLLERYVAEDKLYHRKCYRDLQIETIDNDTEMIGDYLNIYGEWKPSMNKNIFVHPLQGLNSDTQVQPLVTCPAVGVTESYFSDSEGTGSLSSSSSNLSELYANNDIDEKCSNINMNVVSAIDVTEPVVHDDITSINITDTKFEVLKKGDQETTCQENFVPDMIKTDSLKPKKTRLYIKKKDKELPYSTIFEVFNNPKIHLSLIDYKKEDVLCSCKLRKEMEDVSVPDDTLDFNKDELESAELTDIKPKLIEIQPDDIESDLSSVEEELSEMIQPTIVRDSIWRKPIISASLKKHHSASEPIETKYKCYSEFKEKLAQLNSKQSQIEEKGRKVQQKLWEEDPTSEEFEHLLTIWLELVEEKDRIFYEENALYSWLKDLKLQEMKENLECQIRLLSQDKTPNDDAVAREKELIRKLIETVNKRSELIDSLHEENMKRLDAVNIRNVTLEKLGVLQDKKPENFELDKKKEIKKRKKRLWNRKSSQI